MGFVSAIDEILSTEVGNLNVLTSGVDYITIQVDKKFGKGTGILQGLNYIARPLDVAIQLVTSLIFAIYQSGKTVYRNFTDEKKSVAEGFGALAFSPLGAAINWFENLKSIGLVNWNSPYFIFTGEFRGMSCVNARFEDMKLTYPIVYGKGRKPGELPKSPFAEDR